MSGGAYLLARSCVMPDEAFDRLDQLAARLAEITGGRPTRLRSVCTARGPGRMAGPAVRVDVADQGGPFAPTAFVFLPGLSAGDPAPLKRAHDHARAGGFPEQFREVWLQGGVGLAVAA